MENINAKFATGRLEALKQGAIIDDCENINFDSNYGLYNSMINLFTNGYFDPIFNSPAFNGLSTEERRELLKKGREHIDLCFDKGGIANWAEYASVRYCDDFDLCFMNVFKNFDTLLNILRYGKEDSVELLETLKSSQGDFDGSIFDELKLYFNNDDVILTQAMVAMGQKSNKFNQYSDGQKRLLCQYANGILYNSEDYKKGYSLRSPISIALDIREKITGKNHNDDFSFDEYGILLVDDETFTEAVMDLSNENNLIKTKNNTFAN